MDRNGHRRCGPEIPPGPKRALYNHEADEDGRHDASGAEGANRRKDLIKTDARQGKRKERAQEQNPLGQAPPAKFSFVRTDP